MNYLVIEGNIGAGKTSLVRKLSEDLNAKIVLEDFRDNPFLPRFYEDPQKYSFPLELSFLADRYRQHKEELTHLDIFSPLSIADYYFSKSLIFAGINLPDDEYSLYSRLYYIIHQNLPRPDLYVYIHSPVEKLLDNIRKRGRDYEKSISAEYLEKLEKGYFQYMKTLRNQKVLLINVKNLDFINNEDHYKLIKSYIFEAHYEKGINRISDD